MARDESGDLSGKIGGLHLPAITNHNVNHHIFHDRNSNGSSSFLMKEASVKKMFSLVPLGDLDKYEASMNNNNNVAQ